MDFKIIQHVYTKPQKLLVCFMLLFFFTSCDNSKNIIINPISGEKVLVAQKDFESLYWKDAQYRGKELGEGWRLTTIDELEVMYIMKDDLKLDIKNVYFSSTYKNFFEQRYYVTCFDFNIGRQVSDTLTISDGILVIL